MDGSPDPDEVQLEEIAVPDSFEPEPDEPPRSLREPLALILSFVLVAVLVVGLDQWDRRPPTSVFPDKTGQVLIFQDNQSGSAEHNGVMYGAVAVVDLDHRVVVHRYLRGNRPGDQPYFLLPLGRSVVYGWDEIYAAPLDGGSPHRVGPRNSILAPAAKQGRVLVFSYRRESAFFSGAPRVREYSSPQQVVRTTTGMDHSTGASVGRGVGRDIAYPTEHGVVVWRWSKRRVVRHLGSRRAFVVHGDGDLLVWCEGDCRTLHLTDLGGVDRIVRPRAGRAFGYNFPALARVSPDGKFLAVTEGHVFRQSWIGTDMIVIDVATGHRRTAYHESVRLKYMGGPAWSTDGKRLFFAAFDQESRGVAVGEYVLSSGRTFISSVPVAGAFAPIAVDRSTSKGILRAPVRNGCSRSDLSVRAPTCAARF